MRRRHRQEHENHERWMVSYADFITLLFAFFVVMYSISSLNEGKHKVLSESLMQAFSQENRVSKPIALEELPGNQGLAEPLEDEPPADDFERMASQLRAAFGNLISSEQLQVRANELWLEIELSSSLLFPSGDAIPEDQAFEIIEQVAAILSPYDNPIQVEGFTDNVPISTVYYPSNWELSTARAASIVRLLSSYDVDPSRLSAVGYGQYHPVADNATAEGRSRNRRVVLAVSRNLETRHGPVEPRNRQSTRDGTQDAVVASTAGAERASVNPLTIPGGNMPPMQRN